MIESFDYGYGLLPCDLYCSSTAMTSSRASKEIITGRAKAARANQDVGSMTSAVYKVGTQMPPAS